MMTTARHKKSVPKRPDRNVRRQQAAAINLAKGMTIEKAMLQAGYSPSYARDHGYQAVKRPCIQSVFTESCERIMAKRHIEFDEIVEPIFDALKAKVIVKSTQLGDAQEVDLPDYPLRMSAADRLIELYGGTVEQHKEVQKQTAPPLGIYAWESLPLEERLILREEVAAVIQRHLQRKLPLVVSGNGSEGNGSTNGHAA